MIVCFCEKCFFRICNKKLSYRRETRERAMPLEILLIVVQLYEKPYFKGLAMTLWSLMIMEISTTQ